jgi:hypothetical protein
VVFGVAVASAGLVAAVVVAALLLITAGAGRSFADVAGWTMLQRLVPDAVLARIFGILEGLNMAAQGVGAVVASILIAAFGTTAALAVMGLVLVALGFVRLRNLASAERRVDVPTEALALLRGVPMFTPLAPPIVERLASRAFRVDVRAGEAIIREGDPGDRFYVVVGGRVAVSAGGRPLRELGPGDSFGEIALLRDTPRTATVRALEATQLLALEREPFIAAVSGLRASRTIASQVVDERLAAGRAPS